MEEETEGSESLSSSLKSLKRKRNSASSSTNRLSKLAKDVEKSPGKKLLSMTLDHLKNNPEEAAEYLRRLKEVVEGTKGGSVEHDSTTRMIQPSSSGSCQRSNPFSVEGEPLGRIGNQGSNDTRISPVDVERENRGIDIAAAIVREAPVRHEAASSRNHQSLVESAPDRNENAPRGNRVIRPNPVLEPRPWRIRFRSKIPGIGGPCLAFANMLQREWDQKKPMNSIVSRVSNDTYMEWRDDWLGIMTSQSLVPKACKFQRPRSWIDDDIRRFSVFDARGHCAYLVRRRDKNQQPSGWFCLRRGVVFDSSKEYTVDIDRRGNGDQVDCPHGYCAVIQFNEVDLG